MIRRALMAGLLVFWGVAAPALAQQASVADLAARLKSGNAEAKLDAIAKLEELRADAKPAVGALADTLSDADPKVRYSAARAWDVVRAEDTDSRHARCANRPRCRRPVRGGAGADAAARRGSRPPRTRLSCPRGRSLGRRTIVPWRFGRAARHASPRNPPRPLNDTHIT